MTTKTCGTLCALLCALLCLLLAPAAHAEEGDTVTVRFLTDREELLACLTILDSHGAALPIASDPDSGTAQPGVYLLRPGEYTYRFHDESGHYADLEEHFSAEEGNTEQFLTLQPKLRYEVYTFSYSYIDPIYEDVITEADLPTPSESEEELAADIRDLIEMMEGGADDSDAKFRRESGIFNTTTEAAGLELRAQIKEYEDQAIIYLVTEEEPGEAMWKALCSELVSIAFAHTGNPTEGDYLRYEFGGYNAKGAIGATDDKNYCKFIFTLNHYVNADQEAELDEVAADILTSLSLEGKSDYEKVLSIYRYLCEHVVYTGGTDISYTAYGALVRNAAVCQGYSAAFYRLCLASGIDTRIITSSAMHHAWNIVKMGSRYYCLDATWDHDYSPPENYRYFLKGSETWLSEHKVGNVSELGDRYANDPSFAAAYALPTFDYAPEIAAHPTDTSVFAGEEARFTAEASGGDLQFSWQTRTGEADEWESVPDADTSTLTLTPTQADTGRLYRCEVSNLAGAVYSEEAVLTVYWYDLVLPSGLTEIGEEAFSGGAFAGVKLSESTAVIGACAFADCPNLACIYIPAGTTEIAQDAFGDRTKLMIFGAEESYAQSYALERGFDFTAVA